MSLLGVFLPIGQQRIQKVQGADGYFQKLGTEVFKKIYS